ncbi:hypothetical protein C7E25_25115, partial [Stenotrophomonas maltophilia]
MAHVAGLAPQACTPAAGARHVVTSTTHKTLRGPLFVDMAHVAGLAPQACTPAAGARHVVTSTTHKTLRGP